MHPDYRADRERLEKLLDEKIVRQAGEPRGAEGDCEAVARVGRINAHNED